MVRLSFCLLFAGVASLVWNFRAAASDSLCLDPLRTHTNGMPTASTIPCRSGWVGWTCSPHHLGAAGNRYNLPLCNSLVGTHGFEQCVRGVSPADCMWCEPEAGFAGVEGAGFELLGQIPSAVPGLPGPLLHAVPPAPEPTSLLNLPAVPGLPVEAPPSPSPYPMFGR